MKTKVIPTIMITLFLTSITAIAIPVMAQPPNPVWIDSDGDGVYDTGEPSYTTIQAAIDAASAGQTIYVEPGTYEETVTFRSDDYDLDLVGMDGAIIQDKPDESLLYGIDLKGGTHDISISGFEIRDFDGADDAGIAGWTNTWDPDYYVISYITIHHNYIHGCDKAIVIGAWVWWPWGPGISHHHITIHHNEVSENLDVGIHLWGVSESTVAHNVIEDNIGNGLAFYHVSDSNANHNEIHGNTVVGLGVYGGSTGNNFNHNNVTYNDNLGILLTAWNIAVEGPTTGNTFALNDARNNVAWDIREFSGVYGNIWVKNQYDDANPDPPV